VKEKERKRGREKERKEERKEGRKEIFLIPGILLRIKKNVL
jgi:hypothetical protein